MKIISSNDLKTLQALDRELLAKRGEDVFVNVGPGPHVDHARCKTTAVGALVPSPRGDQWALVVDDDVEHLVEQVKVEAAARAQKGEAKADDVAVAALEQAKPYASDWADKLAAEVIAEVRGG